MIHAGLLWIRSVAWYAAEHLGDDFYAALNVAECIIDKPGMSEEELKKDALRVHAILEGEL